MAPLLEGTLIGVGAQNMHWEASGAFTGEVAAPMVAEFCKYVIIGHSERRTYFGETDTTVNLKVKAAFSHGLIPIMCVGETLAENEAGTNYGGGLETGERWIGSGLMHSPVTSLVIAYEPVWAIGTGEQRQQKVPMRLSQILSVGC